LVIALRPQTPWHIRGGRKRRYRRIKRTMVTIEFNGEQIKCIHVFRKRQRDAAFRPVNRISSKSQEGSIKNIGHNCYVRRVN
jgi:hypothetical protein